MSGVALWFPRQVNSTTSGASPIGQTITSSATANTKGSWTQIHAATEFDAYFVELTLHTSSSSGDDTSMLIDIGVDPAGGTSYTVYVPDILCGFRGGGPHFQIPVFIPAGSTIACQNQSIVTGAQTIVVEIYLWGGASMGEPWPQSHGLVVAYGTTSSSASAGTQLSNGVGEGPWTEIVASTTHPHSGVALGVQGGTSSFASVAWSIDVAIGAGGSEVVLAEEFIVNHGSTESMSTGAPHLWLISAPIPEGSRLSARAHGTNNQQQDHEVALYGWG